MGSASCCSRNHPSLSRQGPASLVELVGCHSSTHEGDAAHREDKAHWDGQDQSHAGDLLLPADFCQPEVVNLQVGFSLLKV